MDGDLFQQLQAPQTRDDNLFEAVYLDQSTNDAYSRLQKQMYDSGFPAKHASVVSRSQSSAGYTMSPNMTVSTMFSILLVLFVGRADIY